MKAVLSFISLFTGCFMFLMCSKSIDSECTNHITNYQDISLLLLKHVHLDNSQYRLDLTLEEAIKLGIPKNLYQRALDDIENVNIEIQKCMNMSNSEIILTDFQKILSAETKSCPHPKPLIYLGELNGQICTCDMGTSNITTAFAPSNINHIRFHCLSKAALITVITCSVKAAFGDWVHRSHAASSIVNVKIDVPLTASNCDISLKISTMDSHGVWANFYGIHKSLD